MSKLDIKGDYIKILRSEKPIKIERKEGGEKDKVLIVAPLNTDIRFGDVFEKYKIYEKCKKYNSKFYITFFIFLLLLFILH